MKFFKSKKFKFCILVLLFIFYLLITAKSYASSVVKELSNNVFRLHIIANSDSEEDQNLKLKVRDNIIEYMNSYASNCNSKSEIISFSYNHLNDLKNIAEQAIKDNGYNYSVNVEIGNFYFPTKYYGNVSFPNGYYDALRIKIGKATGQNWWCSLFPALCFTDISSGTIDEESSENLKENLTSEEYSLITNNSARYKLKFKIIELFN